MLLDAYLQGLAERRVSLRVEGDRLVYCGPPGSMLPCDREFIQEHKAELIERLNASLDGFEPLNEEEVPAWVDDPTTTVSLAQIRESLEYDRVTREFEARSPRQPGRGRRLNELARAEANLDAMDSVRSPTDDESTDQPPSDLSQEAS